MILAVLTHRVKYAKQAWLDSLAQQLLNRTMKSVLFVFLSTSWALSAVAQGPGLNAFYDFEKGNGDLHNPRKIIDIILPEVRSLVDDLISSHPPKDWIYLCVGSSPLPLAEGLRIMAGQDSVVSLPMGSAKLVNPSEIQNPLSPRWKMRVDEIARRLPTSAELHGRKILVVDYTTTGRSFNNQIEIIDRVYKWRDGSSPLIVARGYYYDQQYLGPHALGRFMIDFIKAPEVMSEVWMTTQFDWWAEFNSWSLVDPKGPPQLNDHYPLFQHIFRERWFSSNSGCEKAVESRKKPQSLLVSLGLAR